MRATEGNDRVRTWRKLAALVAGAALALTAVGSAAVTATNSRDLYIGSDLVDANGAIIDNVVNATGAPGHDLIPDNAGPNPLDPGNLGVLTPTAVNAGFSTAVPIQILNGDNQTIAHVSLVFPAPSTLTKPFPSLAANGLTYNALGGQDQASCGPVGSPIVTGVSCTFDNLAAGAVRSFFIVIDASQATTAANLFSAEVTTNNENGSNLQTFDASSGTFQVQAASPDGLSTFVPPGQLSKTYNTSPVGSGNKLQTKLGFTQSPGGNLVSIGEDTTTSTSFLYKCPDGLACQAPETTISVQDGLSGSSTQFTSPFLTVTLTALVPKTYSLSKAFVAHYGASVTIPDWTLFWSTKSTRCGTNVAATLATLNQCFNSATLSKPNPDGTQTLVLQVTVKHNGGMRF